jgi:hypothetical protein
MEFTKIKFGTDGYGIENSRYNFIKYENGDVLLQKNGDHNGYPEDKVYIRKKDIKKLVELLTK